MGDRRNSTRTPAHLLQLNTADRWHGIVRALCFIFLYPIPCNAADDPTAVFVMRLDGGQVRRIGQVEGFRHHGSPRWSHDGKRIAFDASAGASSATKVYLVNVDNTGLADTGRNASADWSPDDKQLATHSDEGADRKSGVWIQNVDGRGREFLGPGGAPRWSSDGAEIALVNGGTLWILNLLDNTRRKLLEEPPGEVRPGFDWSPDGARLAFVAIRDAQRADQAELWITDPNHAEASKTMRLSGKLGDAVAWSPDGRRLAVSRDGAIQILDVEGTSDAVKIADQEGKSLMPAWSPDGQWIAFSSDRKSPAWVSVPRAKRHVDLEEVSRHPRGSVVFQMALFPNGRRVLLGGDSSHKNIQIWNLDSGETTQFDHLGQGLALSPDGRMIALCGSLMKIPLLNSETGKLIRDLPVGDMCPSICFSPDGTRIVSGSINKTATVWNIATGKPICVFKKHDMPMTRVAFMPNGTQVASNGQDKMLRIWDAQTAEERLAIEHPDAVWGLAVSPDGRMIATGTGGTTVGNPIQQRIEQGSENILRLWDAETGKLVREMKGHTNVVYATTFSPDGRTLATGGWDGTIRLWDVATGGQLAEVDGQGAVYALVFTPDGGQLIVGGGSQRSAGARLQSFRDEQARLYRIVEGTKK